MSYKKQMKYEFDHRMEGDSSLAVADDKNEYL